MIRINLLPWRDERREQRRKQFLSLLGLVGVAALLLGMLVHGVYAELQNRQDENNRFLKEENAKLDKEIDEIKRLREQTEALLARKRVIESLQGNRSETVQVFNDLIKQMPEGVYIKTAKEQGNKITLVGYAQSNARVSTLMRNLEASPSLEHPDLVEIKSVTINNRRTNEFTLTVIVTRESPDAIKEKAADGNKKTGDKA